MIIWWEWFFIGIGYGGIIGLMICGMIGSIWDMAHGIDPDPWH